MRSVDTRHIINILSGHFLTSCTLHLTLISTKLTHSLKLSQVVSWLIAELGCTAAVSEPAYTQEAKLSLG